MKVTTNNLKKKFSLECKELTFSTALEITTRCVAITGRQFRLRQSSDLLISLFPRWIHPSSSSKHTDEKLFFLFRNAIFTKTEHNPTHGACLKLNPFHPARRDFKYRTRDTIYSFQRQNCTSAERLEIKEFIHHCFSLHRPWDKPEAINNGDFSEIPSKYLLRCPLNCEALDSFVAWPCVGAGWIFDE